MKFLFFLCLSIYCFLFSNIIQAQSKIITGTVYDFSQKETLGHVNIGWINRQLGTISDEKGQFQLIIPETETLPDSAVLRFSMIGYESQEFFWKDIKDQENMKVKLLSAVAQIQEITIVDCSQNTLKKRGNFIKKMPMGWISFASKEPGTEIATRIRLRKRRKSHLKTLSLWADCSTSKVDTLFARLNIYAVENGLPSENLLRENIFLRIVSKNEQINIDLSSYQLAYEQDVFIGLEYIRTLETKKEEFFFGSNFLGGKSYLRFASQSNWIKTPVLNLGLSVEVCEE